MSDAPAAAHPAVVPEAPRSDVAPRPADKVPVAFGVKPSTMDEAWRWASQAAQSTLVPAAYFGKPHDVLVAVQMGVEVGLPPMTALQSIAVINGRPALWGDGFLALIMGSPVYKNHAEYFEIALPIGGGVTMERRDAITADDWKNDKTRAVCTFWRKGKSEPVTKSFSVAQAKKANLLAKAGPWQTYPDRMLQMRARGFAGRDAFPDVLKGLRIAEEVADIPLDATVLDVGPAPAVQRRSAQIGAGPEAAPAPSASPVLAPPLTFVAAIGRVVETPGACVLTTTTDLAIDVPPNDEDAIADLRKFIGTDHQLLLTCRGDDGGRLRLTDYRLAD